MKIPVLPLITFLIICCNTPHRKEEKPVKKEEGSHIQQSASKTTIADSLLITATSMGKLHLGDDFKNVEKSYPTVDTFSMESEGTSWPAKRINLSKDEWILVESTAGTGTIDRIHTNAKRFQTTSGYHIGQKLADIVKAGEKIDVDLDEGIMSVRLYNEKVSVGVDEKSETLFYKKNGLAVKDIRPQATVAEISVF